MASIAEISADKIARYLDTTQRAFDKLRVVAPGPSWTHRMAQDFLRMAQSYRDDAVAFHDKGDLINAFACVNYAHGWLDAGARLGLWDVDGDDALFTLLE